jgi:vacuolar-type H+-ATPase subunit E/Vma4
MSLEPLRTAILAEAEAEADDRRTEVEAECRRRLAKARVEAEALVERARVEGSRAAQQETARRRGAARRQGREALLGARGRLFEQLRRRARADVLELRGDPRYGRLIDRLTVAAKAQLGAEATVVADRPGVGGVFAFSGSRSVDYTLPTLVDRVLADLAGDVEGLWR